MKIISIRKFFSIGNFVQFEEYPRGLSIQFKRGKCKIFVYNSNIIRFIFTPREEFDIDYSYAVNKGINEWPLCSYKISEDSDALKIQTDSLIININKKKFKIRINEKNEANTPICEDVDNEMGICFVKDGTNARSYKKIRKNDHFFGFGEKTGPLDKKGEYLIMHANGLPFKGNRDPLPQSHPFFISINNGIAYGIFLDNISKTNFDMGRTDKSEYYFETTTGDLNYYFIYGPTLDKILELFTELTGRMEMPPKWAIGYHQCRYSYKNEKEIKEITQKFRTHKIPCDGIWFDIHYMEGYRCFTFNKTRFPDPKQLMEELKIQGFNPIVIVDPGIKVDEDYPIYQELINNKYFTRKKNGEPSLGLVWPGVTCFPDFTREDVRLWWAEKMKYYLDLGIEGIWLDMNEPSLSINPLASWIKKLHVKDMYLDNQGRYTSIEDSKNIYALCESWATWMAFKKNTPHKRSFILTRSGFSGLQKYASLWTGDNWTNWKNISIAVRMLLNLNLSAQFFVGADIGGHAGILKYLFRDKKQFIRWIQSGIFYPFCRVHTTIGTVQQDPFSYGEFAQEISKRYIELRYTLIPYWYTLFYNAHKTGAPIIRPLFYCTPNDENCYNKNYENQFFLGEDILIIPINKRRIKDKAIYLPEGTWIHYWTLEEFEGKKEHVIPITLKDIPIFVKKGCIIPTQEVLDYIGQKPIDTLVLNIYQGDFGSSNSMMIYEDDGETMDYNEKNMNCIYKIQCDYGIHSNLSLLKINGNYLPSWKQIRIRVIGKGAVLKDDSISLNCREEEIQNIKF